MEDKGDLVNIKHATTNCSQVASSVPPIVRLLWWLLIVVVIVRW